MTSKHLLTASLLLAACAFTSCSEGRNLAANISGKWKGSSVTLPGSGSDDCASGRVDCTPTFTFHRNGNDRSGAVEFSGVYNLLRKIQTVYTPVALKCSAQATATAKGTWRIDDDSDIDVSFEPSTVSAEIDPSSVSVTPCGITDFTESDLTELRNRIAPGVEDVMTELIRGNISSIQEFEDVTISGDVMTMDIDDRLVRFTREK